MRPASGTSPPTSSTPACRSTPKNAHQLETNRLILATFCSRSRPDTGAAQPTGPPGEGAAARGTCHIARRGTRPDSWKLGPSLRVFKRSSPPRSALVGVRGHSPMCADPAPGYQTVHINSSERRKSDSARNCAADNWIHRESRDPVDNRDRRAGDRRRAGDNGSARPRGWRTTTLFLGPCASGAGLPSRRGAVRPRVLYAVVDERELVDDRRGQRERVQVVAAHVRLTALSA